MKWTDKFYSVTHSNNYLTFLYMCRLVSSGCRVQHWRAEGSSPRSYQYSESKNKHALIKLCLLQLVRRSIILSDKDDKPQVLARAFLLYRLAGTLKTQRVGNVAPDFVVKACLKNFKKLGIIPKVPHKKTNLQSVKRTRDNALFK